MQNSNEISIQEETLLTVKSNEVKLFDNLPFISLTFR